MGKFMIIPTNEGQDLNYIEDFEGTRAEAKWRAVVLKTELKKLLKQGSIDVKLDKVV